MCRVTEESSDSRALAETVLGPAVSQQIKREVLERDPHAAVAYRRVCSNGSRICRVTEGHTVACNATAAASVE